MTAVCERVADGDDIGVVAAAYGWRRGQMMRWITQSPDRLEAYKLAERARGEAIDAACQQALWEIACMSPGEVMDDDWELKNQSEVDPRALRCVSGVTVRTDKDGNKTVSVKFNDKLRAIELLGKMRGLFKNDINVNLSFSSLVERAMTRSRVDT